MSSLRQVRRHVALFEYIESWYNNFFDKTFTLFRASLLRERVCVVILFSRSWPRFFTWKIQVFSSSKLLHLWWVKNLMWGNFTEKWNKGWNYWLLFLPYSVYWYYLENSASNVDILRIKHVDVWVGNRGALVVRHHLFLGEHFRSFTAPARRPSLQSSDDCALGRFFVIVEIIFCKFNQLKSFVFFFGIGLCIFICGLL